MKKRTMPLKSRQAARRFKDGDVLVDRRFGKFHWGTGVLTLHDPEGAPYPVLWNLCPARYIAGVHYADLSPHTCRLATKAERKEILLAMVGKPLEDGFFPWRREAWQPVYDRIIKPVIEAAVAEMERVS